MSRLNTPSKPEISIANGMLGAVLFHLGEHIRSRLVHGKGPLDLVCGPGDGVHAHFEVSEMKVIGKGGLPNHVYVAVQT